MQAYHHVGNLVVLRHFSTELAIYICIIFPQDKNMVTSSQLVYRLGYGPFKAESWVRFPDWEFLLALLAQLDSA